MKNKSAVLVALSMVIGLMSAVYAASGVRGAKATTSIAGTTSIIGVSSGPAVLYGVLLSSGTAFDFTVFFDSNSAVGLVSGSMTSAAYRGRFYSTGISSGTALFNLDPPWQFTNGLMVSNSVVGTAAVIIYEKGRVTQGY